MHESSLPPQPLKLMDRLWAKMRLLHDSAWFGLPLLAGRFSVAAEWFNNKPHVHRGSENRFSRTAKQPVAVRLSRTGRP